MRMIKRVTAISLILVACLLNSCSFEQEKVDTLVWVLPGEKNEDFAEVEEEINKITMEKLKVKVFFDFVKDDAEYSRKVNSKISSGEEIDLCFTGYIDQYQAKVYNQRLAELDTLLDETPKLKKTIPDYLWEGARIDGKIYAVPNEQIAALSTALVISKPLADKYGLDVSSIRKTEDIEPFLETLKTNEPQLFPLRINWGTDGFTSLDDNVFYEYSAGGVYIINDDGEIKVSLLTEDERRKAAAATLYKWYENGYIRPDVAFAIDSRDELAAGKYGVWFETYKPGIEYNRSLLTGNEVYAARISIPILTTSGVQSAMTGISSSSSHKKEAIKLLELVNTEPEILNLLTYGIKDKNYKMVSDNTVERTDKVFNYQTWVFGNQFLVYSDKNCGEDIWTETKKINETAIKSPLFSFTPDISEIKNEIVKCNEVLSKYAVINNGTENPEAYWETLDRELRAVGAEKIKSVLEGQINAFCQQ